MSQSRFTLARMRLAIVGLILVGLVPMLFAPIPGLSDLPNHVARHHLLSVFGNGGPLDRYFTVQWRWVGNLGVDLPVIALAPWLGAEAATRLVAALIAPLAIAGILALYCAVHGRLGAAAFIALPLAFNHAYMFGFLNFALGSALALLLAAAWFAWPRGGLRHALGFGLGALILFTAHIAAWGIFMVIVAGAELVRLRKPADMGSALARGWPLLLPLIPLLAWRSAGAGPMWEWQDHGLLMTKVGAFMTVLRGISKPLDLAQLLLMGGIAALAVFAASWRRIEPRLLASGILLTLLTLATPTSLVGSWGADLRLAPFAVLLPILAIPPGDNPRTERLLVAVALLLFLGRVGMIAWDWTNQSPRLEQRLALLDDVPRGARLGFLRKADCESPWHLNPDRKLAGLAVARREVFTNTLFQIEGADIMIIRDPHLRATWADQSQDVESLCPAGTPNMDLLARRIGEMATDDFDMIWISEFPISAVRIPRGFHVVRMQGHDLLIGRDDTANHPSRTGSLSASP